MISTHTARSLRIALTTFALASAAVGCAGDDPFAEGEYVDVESPTGPVNFDGKADALAGAPGYAPLAPWADLDRDFEALFAPDDPVNSVEIRLIEEVIDARLADADSYAEGVNPYRIRYAVYNLRNPAIVAKLADAEDSGVDVQILIEKHQLDPAKTWNTADEFLLDRGFEFVEDSDLMTDAEYETADLIGVDGSGLMHLKARLFETPQKRVMLSGSMNPGDNAVVNEETLHLIREPAIFDRYAGAYDAVLFGLPFRNVWDDDSGVNVLFTPAGEGPRAVTKVFDWLREEDEQILLMVFSIRDITAPGHSESLVELLGAKARAGVPVYVITDRKQSDGVDANGNPFMWNDDTEDELRAAGVHVYEATNRTTEFTAMHHKVAVLGRTNIRVITDAANWSRSGLGSRTRKAKNIESQLFLDTAKLDEGRTGRRYLAQWVRVLQRYAAQSAGDGEPDFQTVFDRLRAAGDWPVQELVFHADESETRWGEHVFVRGDHEALGAWGASHPGVRLQTDAASYPSWDSEPVTMPLGTPFAWKLTISRLDGSGVQWEAGENRWGLAQPTAFFDADTSYNEGTWR